MNLFITGTDTSAGKTYVATQLLCELNNKGLKTAAMKPIASGCVFNESGSLVNEDALQLENAASIVLPYATVNPFAFEPAIAPHLAAEEAGVRLSIESLAKHIHEFIKIPADIHLIEGAGGFTIPLNCRESYADLVGHLGLNVLLVVGMKLGCLNHALLTVDAIKRTNAHFIGWIANCIDPMEGYLEQNIATLKQWIGEPCLGVVPFNGLNNNETYLDVDLTTFNCI